LRLGDLALFFSALAFMAAADLLADRAGRARHFHGMARKVRLQHAIQGIMGD
jgi:hypothetical protein